ncbi:Conserved_hypothetical protein [Hexamita inflata]|uniref:Uncharacterized protein n=1 Tax=Hexamita inflata TaxID=28002 RepID=A0ABP1GSE1_9EUKA
MGVQIKEFFETAKQQAFIQKQICIYTNLHMQVGRYLDQIKNTQLASSTHPVLLRCAAHVGNLFLQDYCRDWNVWSQIQSIAVKHNVRAVMCATRWTSCLNAAKKIKKWIPPGSTLAIDVEIVRLATKYIQFVEADRADAYVLFQQMNQLKTELIRLNNERSRSMLANIEAREQKYHTTHDKIGQFLLSLDPQNPNTDYETFSTLCEHYSRTYNKFSQFRASFQLFPPLNCFIFAWKHKQRDFDQNGHYLYRSYGLYTPEIQRWKQQRLINKLVDKRNGTSISEQLMHWNEY